MNSIRVQRKEESRTTSNEDDAFLTRIEEYQRRRRKDKCQQEREREYEELRRKIILDYEKRRAESLKLNSKLLHHNRSRSRSPLQHGRSSSSASRSGSTKNEKSTSGAMSLLNESEDPQIDVMELQRIKINIRRNIPVTSTNEGATNELERGILNPEEVVLQRRKGEGCKPIFEREEITKAASKSNQVEELRTIVAVASESLASTSKLRTSKTRSSSLSSKRNHSRSPNHTSYQSRYHTDSKHDGRIEYRDHRRSHMLKKHEEHEERSTERNMKKYMASAKRSHSRERSQRSSRLSMDERSYHDKYRNRSRSRSYERRDIYRSREQKDILPYYMEPVPMPMYNWNFPPRPIVVNPMVPIRRQIPFMNRGRPPALMASLFHHDLFFQTCLDWVLQNLIRHN